MLQADDADAGLTLHEYLAEQQELEAEARAAMPRRFDECSYGRGPLNQALWVCRTCTAEPNVVCYGCSIECHPSCDLVELLGRRGLRCDCGNALFGTGCRLAPAKDARNAANDYGGPAAHNFRGRFCTCDRPCEPEPDSPRTMLQCLACEDWFHEDCLGNAPADEAAFDFLLCAACVARSSLLAALGPCLSDPAGPARPAEPTNRFLARQQLCMCAPCAAQYPAYLREEPVLWEPEDDLPEQVLLDRALQRIPKPALDDGLRAYTHLKDRLALFLAQHRSPVVTREVRLRAWRPRT